MRALPLRTPSRARRARASVTESTLERARAARPLTVGLRSAALLLALLTAMTPGVARAQIGEPPATILAALSDYQPTPTEDGTGFVTSSGFAFGVLASEGVAVEVNGAGTLSDANVRFLGALIGVASGYGDGIAAPVADFFRTRASELTGVGEVAVEVMEYLMFVDVVAGPTPEVSVRFAPQYVDADRFGPPAHVLGPLGAPHVVRLFTDLQCPYCAQFEALGMPVVRSELLPRGDVRLELYHFPLKSIHPNAAVAAEASECLAATTAELVDFAAGEDAFWTFQSALFTHQDAWAGRPDPLPLFVTIAEDAGLAAEGLPECVRSGRYGALVEESYRVAAQDLRLTGTPTVFVDGLKVGDYRDVADYLRLMRLSSAMAGEAQPVQP